MSPQTLALAGSVFATGAVACGFEAVGWRPAAIAFCLVQTWCLAFALASAWGRP